MIFFLLLLPLFLPAMNSESLGHGLYKEESMFYNRVDTDRVGVMGHSMGGGGSLHCAMSWPQKVKAVAPIHPAPGAPASLIYAPMMVPTGALDFVTSPMMVKTAVFDGSPSPKIMPIMNGVAHREPVNYAGASRWNGYLAGFFTLYLKRDLRAAMLIWGEEVGSLSRDSRISVAHRNKGSVIWLESAEAVLKHGEVLSVTGKLTKTLALTRGAHYKLEAFKRIEDGFDVDVGFEIQSINEYEIDFIMHISASPTGRRGGTKSKNQKVTVVGINTNDGGSVSFHDLFLTLESHGASSDVSSYYQPDFSNTASRYDNQDQHAPAPPPSAPPSAVVFDGDSWDALKLGREGGKTSSGDQLIESGTKFTVVRDEIRANIEGDDHHSWADVLYSSSKKMQKKPQQHTFQSLQQDKTLLQGRSNPSGGEGWEAQLFPTSSATVPTSLLPWGAIVNAPYGSRNVEGVVLGVSDFPSGYGDAKEGKPTPKEREIMVWINTVRASPKTFEGAYATRGCSLASFEKNAKISQRPLHLSDVLSQAAQKHSRSMANENFVSHVGLDDSTPFDRMDDAGYMRGYRGENICAGMKDPFDCVVSFMCSKAHRENLMSDTFREMGIGLSSNLASQYKHYWTLNLGHAGIVDQGTFVSSFDRARGRKRTLTVGAHRPEEPIDEVLFTSSFHDEGRMPPDSISVIANGVEFPLELKYGEPHNGLYEQNVQLLSIPMWQVLSGSSPCIIYHFKATSRGTAYRFPELGSYGFGGCDFDDVYAKWVQFQNETAVTFTPTSAAAAAGNNNNYVNSFSRRNQNSRGICLTDLHLCADGTIAERVAPSCQFHCPSGDPVKVPSELDFLKSNGQKSFGGLHTCARTWAQFWSGIWNWCPDVLDEAWNDPKNQYRWLIPLWKEVQKIDWVAASNAMTEFWQNMQQCKTYHPTSNPQSNLMDGFTRSSIRIGNGQAITNMQRVIVKSHVKYEQFTSMKLHLTHKFMVDNRVVEKSILLGNSSNAIGEVVFDDFKDAPMPGWWGSWFETFATTVWNDVSRNSRSAEVQRYAVINGRNVPVRAPSEALIHFSEKSSSSSAAGIWELALSHDDPVQSSAISSWDLMICGEPVSTSLNFTSETHTCGDKRGNRIRHPLCSDRSCERTYADAMHTCGSVSTVGGSSTQPPQSQSSSPAGSILQISDIMHVQPAKGSSVFCSNDPVVQNGWVAPRYADSGLELLVALFHREREEPGGAWKLLSYDLTNAAEGKSYAHVHSGRAQSGCWIYYIVSLRGAGPYDFWGQSN